MTVTSVSKKTEGLCGFVADQHDEGFVRSVKCNAVRGLRKARREIAGNVLMALLRKGRNVGQEMY
jgi:hypothetical protein